MQSRNKDLEKRQKRRKLKAQEYIKHLEGSQANLISSGRQDQEKKSHEVNEEQTGRRKRAATARAERLWEHGIIPYEIESNFTGKWM